MKKYNLTALVLILFVALLGLGMAGCEGDNGCDVDPTPTPIPPTPTPTPPMPTPPNTATPTPPPQPTGDCQVNYTIESQWEDGFVCQVSVKNTVSQTINGWALTWTFTNGQIVTSSWSVDLTQSGSRVEAANDNNNTIIPSGGQVDFGFQASLAGGNDIPGDFKLNGTPCTVTSSGPEPETSPTPTSTPDVGPLDPNRPQAEYPPVEPSSCGAWALTDNVCCGQYCLNDPLSESCDGCGGPGSPECVVISSKACKSGKWPEVHEVSTQEPWHYSRSTHFGLTYAGACGFGLYGLCTTEFNFTDPTLAAKCEKFCNDYPDLCADPQGISLRGNFAAPQGNYYTQFWPTLTGERDNYLSCGECFEVIRTKKDGTEYQPGESGYTKPVVVQIVDSCPCSANTKWCCGSGRDHCAEVADFKYGCPTPPGDLDPDRDPSPEESIHLDLSDIAMSRLQTGDANGLMIDGVIPIKYRRTPCPVVGNIHIWLRSGSAYYFALSVVNLSDIGSIVKVEAQLPGGGWVALERDKNYTSSRPQERYGAWTLPQGAGPFQLPVTLRFTDPSGKPLVSEGAITRWPNPEVEPEGFYLDTGVQF